MKVMAKKKQEKKELRKRRREKSARRSPQYKVFQLYKEQAIQEDLDLHQDA